MTTNTNDNWLEESPEGRLSKELGQIMNDIQRWRGFMTGDKELQAVHALLVAANELLPIVNIQEGEATDQVKPTISAANWANKAINLINSVGID